MTRTRDSAYILCDVDALDQYHETLISPELANKYKPAARDGDQIVLVLRNQLEQGIDKFKMPVKIKLVSNRGRNYLRIGLKDIDPHFHLSLTDDGQILILDLNEQMAKRTNNRCFHVPLT